MERDQQAALSHDVAQSFSAQGQVSLSDRFVFVSRGVCLCVVSYLSVRRAAAHVES